MVESFHTLFYYAGELPVMKPFHVFLLFQRAASLPILFSYFLFLAREPVSTFVSLQL